MNPQPLPVRPNPRVGEPLTAYAARLADANGVTRARVLLPWRHDIDVPTTEVAAVAALAGLDADAASRLTMNRYPLAIRGHGVTRRHGWRLHFAVTWICPSCTPTTGRTDLLWQTALMPVCLRCGCYLVRAGAPLVARPADPHVLGLAALLAELAEASVTDLRPRRRLYRLRRRCATLAATITHAHAHAHADPTLAGHLPPVDVASARAWGAYPTPDPSTAATLLVLVGRRMVRRDTAARLKRQSAEFTPDDRDRLAWFLTRVRHHVAADGLHPDHVPSILPRPGDDQHPPGPGAWLSRARAAAALHILISDASGLDATPATALSTLGIHGIPSCLLIDGIHAGLGLREADAAILTGGLELLVAGGLTDYRRRRDILRPMTHLPGRVRRRLRIHGGYEYTADQLALGWIWTRFTHGPMRSSRWPDLPDRDIRVFDVGLDPEVRLVLHETGQQLLADADLLTIPTTRAKWSAFARRYG
jgi:chorismate mutase